MEEDRSMDAPEELRNGETEDSLAAAASPNSALAGDFPGERGRLFIVATPIGNRDDFTPRARRVLEGCDLVLAEDTRRLFALTRELGLRVRRAVSFHDHNEREKEPEVLALLGDGASVALVSDAGTPLVADPGFRLVCSCRRLGIPVHPVPGPSAPVTALSAAGIAPLPYTFLGFLPRDSGSRARLFESFSRVPTTLVFFERKDRLANVLKEALPILGPRQGVVCRELTKVHEEFLPFRLEEAAALPGDLLGEVTVLLGPPESVEKTSEEEVLRLAAGQGSGLKPRELARVLQSQVSGWSAKELYGLLVRAR
ncbi:MAG: 16S rRNA (cytidine(1402)-2'-O)-methyltransferase [Desulfovibrionaceae bacterium]|nr:16S rRNA (cytidine(1402)-2'-O)-methyltransferase [Desulfovibrionaceae bacterium]